MNGVQSDGQYCFGYLSLWNVVVQVLYMALVEIALVSWGLGVDEFLAMAEEMQVLLVLL